jgi:hypothetical protein
MSGGTIARGNIPRLLQDGVKKVFGQAYNEHPVEYSMIFDEDTSQKSFEIDVQFEGFGLAQVKDEGGDISFDTQRQGFTPTYPHVTYGKGFVVTKEALQDELYNQFSKRARGLAFSMTQTKEVIAANTLNNGGNAAFLMGGGDGVSLFNDAHINGPTNNGTYANRLPVTADLSEASLEDMVNLIGQATDPRGLRIALQGTKLIVPVLQQFEAQRILGSVLQNDTANNATNALRDMKSIRDGFAVNHYLTDDSAWFVKTNSPDGMKYYNRQSVEFGEDNAFTTGNIRYKADERYSFGWTDPRGMYGSIDVL